MLVIAAGSFALLLAVVYLIAAPALRPDPLEEADEVVAHASLLASKDRSLSDIRELDLDLATGKLNEEDHRRLRAAALADTAETIRAIEEAEVPVVDSEGDREETGEGWADLADPLEEMIAARKRALASGECTSCGGAVQTGDAFCRRCGAEIPAPVRR